MAILFDSYSETNRDSGLSLNSAGVIRCGQSFTPSSSGALDFCQFYLLKTGAPTGNITCALYLMLGNLGGNDDVPVNFALAYSEPVDAATLTTSYQLISFNFIDGNRYNLIRGLNYVIAVQYSGGNVSNFVSVGYDNSTPTHAGNQCRFTASWTANAADTCFYVYGSEANKGFKRGLGGYVKVGSGMGRSS